MIAFDFRKISRHIAFDFYQKRKKQVFWHQGFARKLFGLRTNQGISALCGFEYSERTSVRISFFGKLMKRNNLYFHFFLNKMIVL